MEEPNLENLLEDVLKEFNVPAPQRAAPATAASRQQPEPLVPPTSAHQHSTPATSSAGPSGLGTGLPSKKPGPSAPPPTASHAPKPAGLAFDPLRKRVGAGRGAPRPQPPQQQQQQPSQAQDEWQRPQPQLPPDVQQLADDLLKLVHESGLDVSVKNKPRQGGQPREEATTSGASSSSGGRDASRSSSTVQGLMEQTKRTVAAQSKFSRGERGPESSSQGAQQQAPMGGGLLSALGGGDLGGLGGLLGAAGGSGEDAEGGLGSGMVDMIMRQLLSKDVLYTPLKEIRDKYPPWLESSTLPGEELRRYRDQYDAIQAVVRQYDEDPDNFAKLVDLIQEMQKFGDPPPEIVEEIGSSINPSEPHSGDTGDAEGDGDDLDNLELPPDLLKDLPQDLLKDLPPEMQKDCAIM